MPNYGPPGGPPPPPMTKYGRVRAGVTGQTLVDLEWVGLGEWSGLKAWFCKYCPQARPFRENWETTYPDEILTHFARTHPDELHRASLTEPRKPVRVRSTLVDERGNAMFFDVEP